MVPGTHLWNHVAILEPVPRNQFLRQITNNKHKLWGIEVYLFV